MPSRRALGGATRNGTGLLRLFQRVCFAAGTAALITALAIILWLLPSAPGDASAQILPLLAGVLVYLLGHCLRAARLALLLGDTRISLRNLAAFHFWASATALLIPFKLGDVVRAATLSSLTGSLRSGVAFVWMERLFDATILIPLLVIVTVGTPNVIPGMLGLLVGTATFVLLSIAILVLAPDNLRRIGTLVFLRYSSLNSVVILRVLKGAQIYLLRVTNQLTGRTLLLLTYTLFIWVFELAAAWLVMASRRQGDDPFVALLSFFSSLIEGEALGATLMASSQPNGMVDDLHYVVATQIPLLLCGIVAGFLLIKGSMVTAPRGWATT